MTDAAASLNLISYLFVQDVMKQSIQLELTEVWEYLYSAVMHCLTLLKDRCLFLIFSFLSADEQDLMIEKDDMIVQKNKNHSRVCLSVIDFWLKTDNYYSFESSTKLSLLSSHHRFLWQLSQAFDVNYDLQRVLNFENQKIRWASQLTYTALYMRYSVSLITQSLMKLSTGWVINNEYTIVKILFSWQI